MCLPVLLSKSKRAREFTRARSTRGHTVKVTLTSHKAVGGKSVRGCNAKTNDTFSKSQFNFL